MAGRITKSDSQLRPDPRHSDIVLAKFINCVMLGGKKAVAQRVVYDALDQIQEKLLFRFGDATCHGLPYLPCFVPYLDLP